MKKRLFILELKKNIRALPVFFGAMVLMGLVAFLLVFAGSRMLYRNESPLSATIAVVSYEKDSSYVDRLASYLGELSSASKGLKFKIMTEDEARTSLKGGKVFAIMLIPDGMMAFGSPAKIKRTLNEQEIRQTSSPVSTASTTYREALD